MKRGTVAGVMRANTRRMIEREGTGESSVARTVAYSPVGPSGGRHSVDLGGGRLVSMDGGGSSYAPGTAVRVQRATGSREVSGLASKKFQPTNAAMSFDYDPTGLEER